MADLQDTVEAISIIEYSYSDVSGASDIATAIDEPQTPAVAVYPEGTLVSDAGTTSNNGDDLASEGAEYFAIINSNPPADYPTDQPPNDPTERPLDYSADTPLNNSRAEYFRSPEPGSGPPEPAPQ